MSLALSRPSPPATESRPALADGYLEELWRPQGIRLVPRGLPSPRFALYMVMHRTGWFSNGEYGLFLIRQGGRVVHYSCVNPRDFRFPFMAPDDLQIGDVATREEHRGRGLAAYAISRIVELHRREGRTFWYVADEDNHASIAAARKVGFSVTGRVVKHPRFGLPMLGSYHFEPL